MPLRRYSFFLLSFLVISVDLSAQSRSPSEENLRSELLILVNSRSQVALKELRRFYFQPLSIPFRSQPKVTVVQESAISLGKSLFFDKRLSRNSNTACAGCHQPQRHWVDGLPQSTEGNRRRSMALFNLAWDSCFTWHCQAGSLMSQGVLAMTAPKGMDTAMTETAARLRGIAGYVELFRQSYPELKQPIIPETIAYSIELFVSTIRSPQAPFDKWVKGDEGAVSESAKRGFMRFHFEAPCAQCHNLWRFSDSRKYDIGLQSGPAETIPTFKSVGLRNIALRPPYMHDGSIATLEGVLDFYARGGDVERPTKSPMIRPFALSAEARLDLMEFLKTLSGEAPQVTLPQLP